VRASQEEEEEKARIKEGDMDWAEMLLNLRRLEFPSARNDKEVVVEQNAAGIDQQGLFNRHLQRLRLLYRTYSQDSGVVAVASM
jgi:hypothetical protein